jgi:ankyrin repeat protein
MRHFTGIEVNAKGEFGKAPLHYAAAGGFSDVRRLLLGARRIDSNTRNI